VDRGRIAIARPRAQGALAGRGLTRSCGRRLCRSAAGIGRELPDGRAA
jgi:hypothetical protein